MPRDAVFPVKKVQQLRRRAAKAAEVSEDGPEGWSASDVDPMALLEVFPALHVKRDMVLRAFQYRAGGNGNGVVFAVPADLPPLAPEECPEFLFRGFLSAPRPAQAAEDPMVAIGGDGSPWSYLCASILKRELGEFGAMWHGCDWGTHEILGRSPFSSSGKRPARRSPGDGWFASPHEWSWAEAEPEEWRPIVLTSDGSPVVRFHTFTALGACRLCRNVDTYRGSGYCCETEVVDLATGPGGYVF